MLLGELEKQVLEYLWKNQPADAKQVFSYFEKNRGGSLNTIQSTLDRLFKKDLLSREKSGHAYQYFPKVARQELIGRLIKNVTHDFVTKDENSVVAAFSSISSDLDEQQLDKLEAMIEQQRKKLQAKAEK
ncbi:BlaI/MecI/CopY family transcriptional regulator [Colwellia sp. PAMC 21821]|uniref:BlaI/MecI/CopY family transcriptional regulator n=1 Tax=Colwellia sp. PAMC 21821 TaxID=1816219 RepID=UPI0009BD2B4B|nr:BlaI/MecI/CopY family transcriptional regulator [Colwellia sp. PAMC 21821]ARD46255.1 TrmB family transcriptional regulator [Colwellia sp. PAMC 21821]